MSDQFGQGGAVYDALRAQTMGSPVPGGGGGGSGVESIVAGSHISVDNTDPNNPVVSTTGVLSSALTTGHIFLGVGGVATDTALGTGVATALVTGVGSVGAVVVNGGALGTPSGGVLTNATGLPLAGLVVASAQYHVPVSGATPFAYAESGWMIDGTSGGKTVLAVTSGKVVTITATDNSGLTFTGAAVLTVPASGTATLQSYSNAGYIETAAYFKMPVTTGATVGVLYIGANRFIHNYGDPATNGQNTFVGQGAGNFTLSAGGGAAYLASSNTGIGYLVLKSLTTGYGNFAGGNQALTSVTSGTGNWAGGQQALFLLTTGVNNFAAGLSAGLNTNASRGIFIGANSGMYETSNDYTIFINSVGDRSTYTGDKIKSIVYAVQATVPASQFWVFNSRLYVNPQFTAAGVSTVATLDVQGSGAAADGGSLLMAGKSSTTATQSMGSIQWLWNTATHASAISDLVLSAAYNSGASIVLTESIRIRGGASGGLIGFFSATPVVQQLAATDLGTALSNLGLRVAGTAYPITTSGAITFTGIIGLTGVTTFGASAILKGYTVATLPAGVIGAVAYATDLLTPTFLTLAVGGGAVVGPVFFDGVIWKSI